MLTISYDILGAYITDHGLSVVDPPTSFASVIKSQGATSPYLVPPSNNCLMLRPVQLLPSWATATTFRAGDYGSPAGWEEQTVGSSGHYWMHTTGTLTPLTLAYTFPANTGFFVEFYAYWAPKTPAGYVFDLKFGQHYQILLSTDGELSFFDFNVSTTVPIAAGNIANGRNFVNQAVTLVVLPFRRQQVLVWSPSLGGFLDVPVNVPPSGNITEQCNPTLYASTTPPAAMCSITPLMYPADGISAIDAPAISLAKPLTKTPTFTNSVLDTATTNAPHATCSLAAVTTYTASPPVTSFIYSVTMKGNAAHQTAETQGVLGIGASTSTSNGDSVFGGGSYPYSLFSPYLYLTSFGYARSLGANTYTTDVLTGILSAELTLSKDRAQKTFTFTVDNPGDIYTSIADLENRRCKVYFTNPTLLANPSASHAEIAADPDPDTLLIIAYGYVPVLLFDGYTDVPELVDGLASNVPIRCSGLRKQLRDYLFDGNTNYDGMVVNNVVTDVLQRAGFVGSSADETATGMNIEIVCETNSQTLPSAVPGDTPLFAPPVGTTAEAFIEQLENYTGWILDDFAVLGSTNSCFYWCSPAYYASSVYSAQGAPTVSTYSTYNSGFVDALGTPLPDATRPNQGLSSLGMLVDPEPHETQEELVANYILVIGQDDSGVPILAQAEDVASINDRSATNYIGKRKIYILESHAINTQQAAIAVCGILYNNLRWPKTHLEFTLPDYYPQLGIGAPLTIPDYWNGSVENIHALLMDGNTCGLSMHKTTYSALKNPGS